VPSAIRPDRTGITRNGAISAAGGGQQFRQRREQVGVAARTQLDQRQPGGRVRDEHVQQPVSPAGHPAGELLASPGDVVDRLAPSGLDPENFAFHAQRLWQRPTATATRGPARPA